MAIGKLSVILDANIAKFESDLGRAERVARKQSDAIKSQINTAFKAIGVAAIAAGGAMVVAARKFNDTANEMVRIGQLAQGLGVNVGKFSALVEMMDDLGVNAQGTGVLVATLERNLVQAANGSATMGVAFKQLGVNIKGTNEPFAVLLEMAKQIQSHGMTSRTAASLTQLFGSQAKTLGTLLQQGPEAIKKAVAEMLKSGQAFDENALIKATQYFNAIDAIGDKFTALKRQIVVGLAPAVSELAGEFSSWVDGFVKNGGVDKIKNAFTDIRAGVDYLRKGFALFSLAVQDAAATLAFFQTLGGHSGNIVNNGREYTPDEFAQNMQAQLAGKKAPNAGTPYSLADRMKAAKAQFQTLKDVFNDNNAAAMATFESINHRSTTPASAGTAAGGGGGGGGGGNTPDPAKLKALQSAYEALAVAAQKANESQLSPKGKALATYTDGIRELAKTTAAYVTAGGDAATATRLFLQGKAGLTKQYTDALSALTAQTKAYGETLQHEVDLRKAAIAIQVASVGMGQQEAQRLQELNDVRVRGAEAVQKLQQDLAQHPEQAAQINAQIALQIKQTSELVTVTTDGYASMDAARASWQNGLKSAFQDWADQGMDVAGQMKGAVTDAFGSMNDALVSFVQTGKVSFKSLADGIISDLARIALRIIESRILQSIMGAFFTHSYNASTTELTGFAASNPYAGGTFSALGNVFTGPGIAAYENQIVSKPTMFANGGNVMGEAGPEAIMPLSRGPNGKLGVVARGGGGVTVIVENHSDQQAKTTQSKDSNGNDVIKVLIGAAVGEVNKQIARNGSVGQTIANTFGLARRGVPVAG